ncbi:MAG: hypothetical protein RL637_714 [Pseudomonadota bacterium]|jgi:hypothetical protein
MTFHYWLAQIQRLKAQLHRYLFCFNRTKSATLFLPADFDNSGFCLFNELANSFPHKTIIVIGIERSGTSMIAGVLAKLGIFMGNTQSHTYEDHEMAECLRMNDYAKAQQIIQQRNQLYPIWGFKKPSLKLLNPRWQKLFRDPIYIVVFRDILAIANRRTIGNGSDLFTNMNRALYYYLKINQFIDHTERPVLAVSYEKALFNPELLVKSIADFIGIVDQKAMQKAIDFIQPSPIEYRIAATSHKEWLGHIETVSATTITGWAFRCYQKESVKVILTLATGEELISYANLSRQDVQRYHHHLTEYCGFEFKLLPAQSLIDQQIIRVRIENEFYELTNSPFTYKSL